MNPPASSPVSFPALADLPGRPCPIAAALEVVGERWALLIVRELCLGAHRFGEIVIGTGAPRDRIAARLQALESVKIVERRRYQTAPERYEYHLTDSGRALVPTLEAPTARPRPQARPRSGTVALGGQQAPETRPGMTPVDS